MGYARTAGGAALVALLLAHAGGALALSSDKSQPRPLALASNAHAKPTPAPSSRPPERAAPRAKGAVHAVTGPGPEQAGYVHYFLLQMPDETVETQVGIELADGRIAWSVPGLGVVVSPFIEQGTLPVGDAHHEFWHLYGVRPFPDDASMNALRREIAGRVERWVKAGTPYCENDGPFSSCMSCLGFVLRVLYPGRYSDYPSLPPDFRSGPAGSYTTRELLLYLTGMFELTTRDARLKRIAQLGLPEALRDDLADLVYARAGDETPAAAPAPATAPDAQKRRVSTRPAQRKRL